MLTNAQVPLLGFAAFSDTGKTTLLASLLPLLRQRGLRIGVIKHARHGFDIDHPGKDSYVLREAGASQMLIGAPQRWALVTTCYPTWISDTWTAYWWRASSTSCFRKSSCIGQAEGIRCCASTTKPLSLSRATGRWRWRCNSRYSTLTILCKLLILFIL